VPCGCMATQQGQLHRQDHRPARRRAASGVVHRRHRLHSQSVATPRPRVKAHHIGNRHCRCLRPQQSLSSLDVCRRTAARPWRRRSRLRTSSSVSGCSYRSPRHRRVARTCSFITHGHIVVPIGHWFGHRVGLTSQGLRSAALIVVRVATSNFVRRLVALTTTWTRLLAALRSMLCHECSSGARHGLSIRLPSAWFGHRHVRVTARPAPCRPTTWCGRVEHSCRPPPARCSGRHTRCRKRGTGHGLAWLHRPGRAAVSPSGSSIDLAWVVGCAIAIALVLGSIVPSVAEPVFRVEGVSYTYPRSLCGPRRRLARCGPWRELALLVPRAAQVDSAQDPRRTDLCRGPAR